MTPHTQKLRVVCISDTHNHSPGEGFTLPKGDVLIHAGDLTNQGSYAELKKAVDWIEKVDFAVKVVVADAAYELKHAEGWRVQPTDTGLCRKLLTENKSFTYLENSSALIEIPDKNVSLRVFGSPYSRDRGRQNWAFQYPDERAEEIWSAILDDTDVLVTHTPPAGHCDTSSHWVEGGCPGLTATIGRVKPLLHVCGHCHEGRGAEMLRWGERPGTVAIVRKWEDPGAGNKKQSLLNLTGSRAGEMPLEVNQETAVVNASIVARSFGRGGMAFNKPIVVDLVVPVLRHREAECSEPDASVRGP
ncbi:hypothetical protein LTR91_010488 [Friedmanniomyces endolithicus]|uniref:Calcineurin-like phosphoesterase domain-containing protein n=1 Tax=Friedmanniomyces endolithicus TaxID=329885 RepID=A0AAN6QSN4_9PEZI|nr:hypothetical protein LTR57_001110 [Friedmanniomyces endolithicus]KAK0985752.1 hypothetical protein LTR91_010488 [Friedmanniomyces endolithicus]KAK1014691.1 hypothetical protein LTS01_000112 [Friedmanniomyces endolithicus]KAK1045119.1 hypothetical protein LTS16_006668 [Friedmanniomyces endolithicus]